MLGCTSLISLYSLSNTCSPVGERTHRVSARLPGSPQVPIVGSAYKEIAWAIQLPRT